MNWVLTQVLADLWENSPILMVLGMVGLMVFLVVVVDAWREKRRQGRKNRTKY